MTALDTEIIFF